LIYPAILVCVSLAIVTIMIFKVIPAFAGLFTTLGTTLPWQTEMLVKVAVFLQSMWKEILTVVVAGAAVFLMWKRSPAGQVGFDRLKMSIPLVGGVIRDYAQNRFTRTLSTLLAGGIPLVTSLELAARAVGNFVFEKELLAVTVKVREPSRW
jgi:type IV pilus assembly protein PilC